jgi:hypothetical protein
MIKANEARAMVEAKREADRMELRAKAERVCNAWEKDIVESAKQGKESQVINGISKEVVKEVMNVFEENGYTTYRISENSIGIKW